jgi:ATP-binding cassette subfamily B multidrug efflux pump
MVLSRLKPLVPYLKKYWRSFAWGGAALVVYNVSKALVPIVIGHAFDDLRHNSPERVILHLALLLLLIASVSGTFLYIMRQVIIGASREIEFDLRNDLFARLETQSPSFFQRHRTGDIMARSTNDLNAVRQLLGPAIMYSANTVVFTAAALPYMLHISPRLTLFAFVPLPFASILVQYFGAKIHSRFERIQAMFSEISAQAEENFSGARLIRAFAQEEAQSRAFEQSNLEYIRRSLLLARLMAMLWPTLELVLGVSLMITLLVGGHEVLMHRMTAGQFGAYNVYMVQLTWPMIAIGWVVNLVQRGAASVVRIDQLMQEAPGIDDSAADTQLASAEIAGDLEFRGLSFAYPNSVETLHDISLHVPAGGSLAIVGPTGAGKSTLMSLVPRLQDAPDGSVLIDGRPVREYPLSTLRSAIGYVPQETFLFSTTIRDNISFGRPDATIDEIIEAAHTAHIGTEIEEFPAGYGTVVGERGLTLSGGQKQRTSIARAIVRDPRILILDDALASVDTFTEEQILTSLRETMRGRTTLLVSHRVSTARSADHIAVLIDGRIAEFGTHDELIAGGGYYSEVAEKQRLEQEIVAVQ